MLWERECVADTSLRSLQSVETAALLRLPLTEDAYLKHTRDLSVNYYRAVLAAGR